MNIPWYENLFGNYLAGVGFSFTDRLFSKNAKRKTQERIAEKEEQTEALNYLVETEQSENRAEIVKSREYLNAVSKAREYFEEKEISFEKDIQTGAKGLISKIAEKGRYFRNHERINNLKAGKQFAVAYGMQFAADAGVFLSQISLGYGHIGRAFALTPFQGLALFLGMQTGKGFLYVKDKSLRSKKEKGWDRLAKELTEDGKLLEIVRNYSPTAELKVVEAKVIETGEDKQLPAGTEAAYGTKAKDLGEKVGEAIADATEGLGRNIKVGMDVIRERVKQRKAARKAKEKQKADALREIYKNY